MTGLQPRLEVAILRGLEYILQQQDAPGSWTDWALPPGSSSEWTTAYVGYRLQGARPNGQPHLEPALDRAATWLLDHQFSDGGWGYNPSVPSDADSTALAILFLSAMNRPPPPQAYEHLRHFQRNDGGFSTYIPDGLTGSWGHSHPEITPIAALALLTDSAGTPTPAIDHAIRWIQTARRPDGTWNAFWWTTGLGATEASLACLTSLGRPEPAPDMLMRMKPGGNLQSALLLSVMATRTRTTHAEILTTPLIAAQAPDGSWCSEAILRVTKRDCDTPWNSPNAGPLFGDPRKLFTTATVVAALSRFHSQLVTVHDRPAPGSDNETSSAATA